MAFITQNIKKIFSSWLIILSVLLLSSMIYTITHLIETGKEAKVLKVDYEQLHSLQYGLLNSNVWTEKITTVFRQKIDEFDFTSTSRE